MKLPNGVEVYLRPSGMGDVKYIENINGSVHSQSPLKVCSISVPPNEQQFEIVLRFSDDFQLSNAAAVQVTMLFGKGSYGDRIRGLQPATMRGRLVKGQQHVFGSVMGKVLGSHAIEELPLSISAFAAPVGTSPVGRFGDRAAPGCMLVKITTHHLRQGFVDADDYDPSLARSYTRDELQPAPDATFEFHFHPRAPLVTGNYVVNDATFTQAADNTKQLRSQLRLLWLHEHGMEELKMMTGASRSPAARRRPADDAHVNNLDMLMENTRQCIHCHGMKVAKKNQDLYAEQWRQHHQMMQHDDEDDDDAMDGLEEGAVATGSEEGLDQLNKEDELAGPQTQHGDELPYTPPATQRNVGMLGEATGAPDNIIELSSDEEAANGLTEDMDDVQFVSQRPAPRRHGEDDEVKAEVGRVKAERKTTTAPPSSDSEDNNLEKLAGLEDQERTLRLEQIAADKARLKREIEKKRRRKQKMKSG